MFSLVLLTPDKKYQEEDISSLVVPAAEGSLGILSHHAPLVTILQRGVITFKRQETIRYLAIDSGILEVDCAGKVLILADHLEEAPSVDDAKALSKSLALNSNQMA